MEIRSRSNRAAGRQWTGKQTGTQTVSTQEKVDLGHRQRQVSKVKVKKHKERIN